MTEQNAQFRGGPLPIARSPLCDIDGVQLLSGKSIGAIRAMTDGRDLVEGQLKWVWNVATNPAGKIRDLRFLVREALALGNAAEVEAIQSLSLEQVIFSLLAESRREFPAGEVCQLLQIRPITLRDLRVELNGALRANSGFYPRQGLVTFFRNRSLQTTTLPADIKQAANRLGSEVPAAAATPLVNRTANHSIAPSGVIRTGKFSKEVVA